MKKLNNKGMTLVELIVSFMIVSVAMLYFFQTLRTVQKIYKNSFDKTAEYIDWDYALRITAAFVEGTGGIKYLNGNLDTFLKKHTNFSVQSCDKNDSYGFEKLLCYEVSKKNGSESKRLYFYLPYPTESDTAFQCYNFKYDSDGNITGINSRKICNPFSTKTEDEIYEEEFGEEKDSSFEADLEEEFESESEEEPEENFGNVDDEDEGFETSEEELGEEN